MSLILAGVFVLKDVREYFREWQMKKLILLALLPLFFSTGTALAEFSAKDSAAWWKEVYGVVDPGNDPLVAEAHRVFDKVAAAADKCSSKFPDLVVIEGSGDPYAVAIKDGSIILTHGAIKLCYKNVPHEKGSARLAFILGHELAHLAKNHFWHQAAFEVVKEFAGRGDTRKTLMDYFKDTSDITDDTKALEVIRKQELQADADGIIYAALAGYDPGAVVASDGTNFFQEWVSQITREIVFNDPYHPTPRERAELVRSQLASVVRHLDYFRFGVRLFQLGRYEEALTFFNRFRDQFPGREVFSNIGLAHYQIAIEMLAGCDPTRALLFKLPAILETDTLAKVLLRRGPRHGLDLYNCSVSYSQTPNFEKAVAFLKMAVSKDPGYLLARVNLASALIMAGNYSEAISEAEKTLKIRDGYPPAMITRGVALYLNRSAFRRAMADPMTDFALEILKDAAAKDSGSGDALYNIAAILQDQTGAAVAKEAWMAYLKVENRGPFADAARKAAGLPPAPGLKKNLPKSTPVPPVKLGNLSAATRKQLQTMERKDLLIDRAFATIYRDNRLTVYVINNKVEMVDVRLHSPIGFSGVCKKHGAPLREVASPSGSTCLFPSFAADVKDGKVVAVVYFEGDGA